MTVNDLLDSCMVDTVESFEIFHFNADDGNVEKFDRDDDLREKYGGVEFDTFDVKNGKYAPIICFNVD